MNPAHRRPALAALVILGAMLVGGRSAKAQGNLIVGSVIGTELPACPSDPGA